MHDFPKSPAPPEPGEGLPPVAADLRDALAAVVRADDAFTARRPTSLPPLSGVATVVGHWVRQDELDPYTEWPESWCALYQVLKRLGRPA